VFSKGKVVVETIAETGCNCICFGEMGIGNTATASVLMSIITAIPLDKCVGMGTGISNEKLIGENLKKAVDNYYGSEAIEEKLYFGGFEMVQMGIR
jgi:nicotinate-nucleotide--dimethylbenzimidazole phosphoribosyltransferase